MKTVIQNLSQLAFAALILIAFSGDARAQSATKDTGFGGTQVSNILSGSSASRFSVQNIQASIRGRSVSPAGVPGINARNFLGSSSVLTQRAKPFSGLKSGPNVSPYLALSGPRSTASDYYNLVRPQQQQQRSNQRAQYAAIQQQRRLNQLAARAPFSTTGDANSAPTGHVAVFQSLGSYQNTGGYFPPPSRPKQR